MAGKYTPLEKYLRDLPERQNEVTLHFEQIESTLNTKLPASASNVDILRCFPMLYKNKISLSIFEDTLASTFKM